jgi:hypothetical protein
MWRDLEQQVRAADNSDADETGESDSPVENVAGLVRRAPARRGRRVFRSTYLS